MGDKVSTGQLQRAFAHSILYKNESVFPLIEGKDNTEIITRLRVYHNNVYSSLSDALAEVYKPIFHALGEEVFNDFAKNFVEENPPVSGCLYAYGEGFEDFLKKHLLSKKFPWLPEVAHLCWCTSQALSIEDTIPISKDDLSAIPPEQWGDLCFSFPKAFFLEKVSWELESLWKAVKTEGSVDFDALISADRWALISRPRFKTTLQWIDQGLFEFLRALQEREKLSTALEKSQKIDSDFDLAHAIQFLLLEELVVGFSPGKNFKEPGR